MRKRSFRNNAASGEAGESFKPYNFWGRVLVPLICLAGVTAGMLLLFTSARAVFLYLASSRWVEVPCRIESAEVEEKRSSSKRGVRVRYRADIAYSYTWENDTFSGKRVIFGDDGLRHKREATARLANYSSGGGAVCRVNPNDPAEAVLLREISPLSWLGTGAGGFLVCIFGGVFYFALPAVIYRSPEKVTRLGRQRAQMKLAIWFKAFFVNGVVAIFLTVFFVEGIGGLPKWAAPFFFAPFIGWGLWEIREAWKNTRARVSGGAGAEERPRSGSRRRGKQVSRR